MVDVLMLDRFVALNENDPVRKERALEQIHSTSDARCTEQAGGCGAVAAGHAEHRSRLSGKQDVADLLKEPLDKTISIAVLAKHMPDLRTKYGAQLDRNQTGLVLGQTNVGAEGGRT
jgi:hypothetical protein